VVVSRTIRKPNKPTRRAVIRPRKAAAIRGRKVAQAPDPIFAAIDAHERTYLDFCAAHEADDTVRGNGPAVVAAEIACDGALRCLIETQPTSRAGHFALLRYISDHGKEREAFREILAEMLSAIA
jgi:hypothetical protein